MRIFSSSSQVDRSRSLPRPSASMPMGRSVMPAKSKNLSSGLSFAGVVPWRGYAGVRFGAYSSSAADAYQDKLNARRSLEGKAPIRLSPEQRRAVEALSRGQGVVADIPTGAGKTLMAEYALERAMAVGKTAFYTTPQKALSNQKYTDFARQYGAQNVGLKTGDVTINPNAPIVIMTTEVYRNMLYDQRQGQSNPDLDNLGAVVFDECHYIDDPDRGMVWEEAAIYTPPNVQQVHLSATIQNAGQYTDWLNSLNATGTGEPALAQISSRERPVPLVYEYLSPSGELVEVLNRRAPEAMSDAFKKAIRTRTPERAQRGRGPQQARRMPGFNPVKAVETLQRRNRLPADFLVFSRKRCDMYAEAVFNSGAQLLNASEQQRVDAFLNKYLDYYPELRESGSGLLPLLKRGIAFHHSGLLPPEKLMVELLLQRGLVKATFSTETLTTGMNVPFRSMVVTATSKYGNNGIEPVSDSTFQQAVGRAGRPGMYNPGYAILTQPTSTDPALTSNPANRLMDLIQSEPNRVESQLQMTPGMVLNLLNRLGADDVEDLLDKSFATFQRGGSLKSEFAQMRKFLQKTGFISNTGNLKPLGRLAADISNDHSLLVSKMIASGGLDFLSPTELAALLSITVQENNKSATVSEVRQSQGRNARFSRLEGVQAGVNQMDAQLQSLLHSAGPVKIGSSADLYPDRIRFIETLCEGSAQDKLDLLRSEEFPGSALNVVQRTANVLKHIAESDSPLVSPELKATAGQAIESLIGGPVRNMVEPRLLELPD